MTPSKRAAALQELRGVVYDQVAVKAARRRTGASMDALNPFAPGQGEVPPFLAGRGSEQALIGDRLSQLAVERTPGSDLILYRPRGNGKTALLEWTLREARALGIKTIDLSSAAIKTEEQLAHQLSLLPSWLGCSAGSRHWA